MSEDNCLIVYRDEHDNIVEQRVLILDDTNPSQLVKFRLTSGNIISIHSSRIIKIKRQEVQDGD